MLRLSLLVLSVVAISVYGDVEDVKNAVNEVTTTKDGALYCPVHLVGTACPSSSFFHYYKCCGDLNKDCCFNLQTWAIVVLALIAVVMLASFILSLIRCVLCRR
ncbi:sup-1 [Pristionchus pacificus]|uniref:Sup-1 n=1 Tax=Pristionchus pacificus TaxID=54126 RepID=A0A2A6CQY8_PRIPA|nr:sup-1 [Pristionchus pacificus]|eukprot:PDM80477.1 sup-1 [Pristionchus pacificus]